MNRNYNEEAYCTFGGRYFEHDWNEHCRWENVQLMILFASIFGIGLIVSFS